MANENDVAVVDVSLEGGGITRQGFGILMLLSNTGNAWASSELTRDYADLDAVAADFPSGTPEYGAASEFFGQELKPPKLIVGKGTNKPQQVKQITIGTVANSTLYKVNLYNSGRLWSAEYTSDASATRKEIVEGLKAAITPSAWASATGYTVGQRVLNDTGKIYECTVAGTSAGSGGPTGTGAAITDNTATWKYIATPNFAATEDDVTLTLTGSATGNWFSAEPLPVGGDPKAVSNYMSIKDTTADPGVATDLTAIKSYDARWFAVGLLFKSTAILSTPSTGVATWCNANRRLLLASLSDTESATVALASGTDCLAVLEGAGQRFVAGMWHPRDYVWFDFAKLGFFLPREPGSYQWSAKSYAGVDVVSLTDTHKTNLNARRSAFYYLLGGTPADGGLGQVMDSTWGFIDTVVDLEWFGVNAQADLIDLELGQLKVANTGPGRAKIKGVLEARCENGIAKGVVAPDPYNPPTIMDPYLVTVPPVSDTASFNATTRKLSNIEIEFNHADAVRTFAVLVRVAQ